MRDNSEAVRQVGGLEGTERRVTLLMSATITPANRMPGAVRNDPRTRFTDYMDALNFYLSTTDRIINQVVLLENSGHKLDEFYTLHRTLSCKKEFHAMNTSSSYDGRRGKGFAEFMMIDEGIRRLLSEGRLSYDTVLWKITGRLIIRNIEKLVESMPKSVEVYCDLRSVPIIGDSLGGNDWMDLRVFAVTVGEYGRSFAGKYDSGFVLEKDFFQIMRTRLRESPSAVCPRFKIQPNVVGVSGYSNKSYHGSIYTAKSALRAVTRRILPALWL